MDELVASLLSNPPLTQRELSPLGGDAATAAGSDGGIGFTAQCSRLRGTVVAVAASHSDAALASLRCSHHPFVAPVLAAFHCDEGAPDRAVAAAARRRTSPWLREPWATQRYV